MISKKNSTFSMFKLYQKAHKGMMQYKHFTIHRWSFNNGNLKALYKSLTESDKETFDFDIWNVSNNFLNHAESRSGETDQNNIMFFHRWIGPHTSKRML